MLRKQEQSPIKTKPNITRLAKTLGVSVPYLSQVMNGRRTPSVRLAKAIAAELGWRVSAVLELER